MFTSPWPSITGDKGGGQPAAGPAKTDLHPLPSLGAVSGWSVWVLWSLFLCPPAPEAKLCVGKSPVPLVSGAQAGASMWGRGVTHLVLICWLVQVPGLLLPHFLGPACLVVSLLPLCPSQTTFSDF